MEIQKVGSKDSAKGPVDWFTGTVRIDPLFEAKPPARASAASVTFEPGAAPADGYATRFARRARR